MPLLPRIARSSLLLLASVTLLATSARAQTTTWVGTTGNWSTPANWSNGEPTAGVTAIIQQHATVQVTMAGETCQRLVVGTGVGTSLTIGVGGVLTVVETMQVPMSSSGTVMHQLGTVNADSLILGNAGAIGQYQMSNGMLNVNHLVIGTAHINSTANFTSNIGNPAINVAHSLRIGRGANIVHGAGTLNVGTSPADSVVVLGAWQMANRPATNVTNFVLGPMASFNVTILFNGITTVVSSGAAILDGTLNLNDLQAPDGTYELIRGNPLTGSFDTINILPAQANWSWRIEGNSFLVTKGMVAVEPVTWSGVKAGNLRN